MYASVRQYRTRDTAELVRRVRAGFVPVVRKISGFSDYYLIDVGDGAFMTITVGLDQTGVEESVAKAQEWVSENAADLIEDAPTVTNGEVAAHSRLRPPVI